MNKVVNLNEMLFQVVGEQNELMVAIEYLLKLNDHVHLDHDLEKKTFFIEESFEKKSVTSTYGTINMTTAIIGASIMFR
jgi:hypothetical protein